MHSREYHLDVIRSGMNYLVVILHAWAAPQYVQWSAIEFWNGTFICSHLRGQALVNALVRSLFPAILKVFDGVL